MKTKTKSKKTACAIDILGWLAFINLPSEPKMRPFLENLHYTNQFRYFPELEEYLRENQIPYHIEYEEDFL